MAKYEYATGSSVYVTASFTDPRDNDNPVNPSTVTLVVTAPDDTATTVEAGDITNTATGEYEYVLPLAQEGTYRWKWTGTLGSKVVVIPGSCDSVDRS